MTISGQESITFSIKNNAIAASYILKAEWFQKEPQFNLDSIGLYFNNAINTLEKNKPIQYRSLTVAYLKAADFYLKLHFFPQADAFYEKLWSNWIQIPLSEQDKQLKYQILKTGAFIALQQGQRPKALDRFQEAYSLNQNDTSLLIKANLMKDAATFYYKYGLEEEQNIRYQNIEKSYQIYQMLNQPDDIIVTNALLDTYKQFVFLNFEKNRLDSSAFYLKKIKEILPKINEPYPYAWYDMIYGSALIKKNKYEEAKQAINNSIKILETYHLNNTDYYQYDLKLLGDIAKIQGNYEAAIKNYLKAKDIAEAINYNESYIDALTNISEAYELKGDYTNALKYNKLYTESFNKKIKEQYDRGLKEFQIKFDIEAKEKELEKQRIKQNIYIGFIVVALILIGLLTFFYYRQKKDKKILEEQKAIIEHQTEELRFLDIAKTRFFANVSHELRTPLTLMIAPLSTMIKSGSLDDKNLNLANIVRQNAKGLLKLVNEILDLNKLEAGKMTLHETNTNLFNFIQRIISSFESSAEIHNIDFKLHYQLEQSLQLALDVNKVEKILNNLLANAFKFTPPKGFITVTVNDKEGKLKIVVADSGRGIHPNDLPHIFNRFYQSKQVDALTEGGTGIGLSLSLELAKLLGGTITAESIQGKGSVFTIDLPKKDISDAESIQENFDSSETVFLTEGYRYIKIDQEESAPQQEETILIVEDNQNLRDYLSSILKPKYAVLKAENGQVALDILNKKSKPHLILSDVMMPIMDGFQLLSQLKSSDVYCSIPVIMLTARAELQDKIRALRIGVDDYLVKPFEEEELFVRIENLIKYRRMQQLFTDDISENDTADTEITVETSTISAVDMTWLAHLETIVRENIKLTDYSVERLASDMAMSRTQLFRKLKHITGLSPQQYLQEVRLQQALYLLETKQELSVKAVCYAVGLLHVKNFSQLFKERFGKSPSSYL